MSTARINLVKLINCHKKPGLLVLLHEHHYLSSNDADFGEDDRMRTTVTLDDELIARAISLTGTKERGALLREALTALIERESAQRLAHLGGTEPDLKPIPRRRSPS